jgi:putative pyruvate formate lyase activating enzyme
MYPRYIELHNSGELDERVQKLNGVLKECTLCPRECKINRLKGKYGVCRSTSQIVVSSLSAHLGEEPPLVGWNGSGTIFFTNCNMWCLYCQNYDISHLKRGEVISVAQLAEAMISLQQLGCHNINLVTPTHFVPQIVEALSIAVEKGLSIPIVYNCGGYESIETLKLLDGLIDIYMPDIKYSENINARKYSGVGNYWDVVRKAVIEMHRQVGDLKINTFGIAEKGLLIRHLVIPNDIAGSKKVINFIKKEICIDSYVNIMDQYRPAFKAYKYPELNRKITTEEYDDVVNYAESLGLHRGFGKCEILTEAN